MFDTLTERLSGTLHKLAGQSTLTEDNIKDTLREVRMALLEADVALPVARDFVAKVKEQALGQEVLKELAPGQAFVKIVYDELTEMMGSANQGLEMTGKPPVVYLLAGLQGAGKTTTAGKLAKFLQDKQKKKVMLVSADVYRPAAINQLEFVAGQVGAMFVPSSVNENPIDIAHRAIEQAKIQFADILIIDTAGRLAIDEAMMTEIKELTAAVNPTETLFVVDSMTGQDAANTAKAFNDALPLTGVILTKTDGDARGGAALSVRVITGKPIKFLGRGEKLEALELFHPERIAQRILGMGDVLSLVEEVENKIDRDKAERMAKKIQKGGEFDLEDLLTQFQQMKNMGGMAGFLDKMPGMSGANIQDALAQAKPEEKVKEMEALIHSMTPFERQNPDKITPSRKRRIAAGSGKQIQDVNALLKQHKQMAKMMKMISRPDGIEKMMKAVQGLTRGMSGGGGGPLFGGNKQQEFAKMTSDIHEMGVDPSTINLGMSEEQVRQKMNELQNASNAMGGKFKKRF
ncbi:signal recognition particle protein [Moraxella bovis]|uniref:Signal recognition particle protein n=3 Tax=Moraxella TaxID=475 RepID=A0AAQ2Q519_MORBO|nr:MULTISPECIES: signal recognition particle protein [Moraxella]AWY20075.1 signal recognition particle protein [Moraxella bovis]OOR91424.1 signal recognition particle protein [Moraxella bovis]UYZ74781.1 signal recognition particle protein [Moraxella bovis]UYZ79292.1 signal recognition particle protein [Moraxella bovis]UYZ80130.1 signal recognition particle protein [Moraxella bovis]